MYELDKFHNAMETGSLNKQCSSLFFSRTKSYRIQHARYLLLPQLGQTHLLVVMLVKNLGRREVCSMGFISLGTKSRIMEGLYRNLPVLREFVALGERTFLLRCTHPSVQRRSTHSFSPQSS